MDAVKVPYHLLDGDLPVMAQYFYIWMTRQAGRDGKLAISNAQMARCLGVSRPAVRRYIRRLLETGWLSIERRSGKITHWHLHDRWREQRLEELKKMHRRLQQAEQLGEALMREWLNLLIGTIDYIDNARPGFLRNPLTEGILEFDRFYPPFVAFEFNGPQHYGPTVKYPDEEQAKRQILYDYAKSGMSQQHQIHLIIITATDLTPRQMQQKLKEVASLLPLRQVDPDDPVLVELTAISNRYIQRCTVNEADPLEGKKVGRLVDKRA